MDFHKTTTKSGFRIITAPMKSTNAVTLLLLTGAGSRYETDETSGLAHFLEHAVFKGTKERPGLSQIGLEIDRLGGINNAFTGKECMGFWIKIDSKHFGTALDIIADVILNPLFKKDRIDAERGTILEERNMILDDPPRYVADLWEMLLYKDQPLGRMNVGEKKTILSISRKDFISFLKDQFTAKNCLFCVVGNINPRIAVSEIEKQFSSFKDEPLREKIKTEEFQNKPEVLLHSKKTGQTHFCFGVRTWGINTPKKYILELISAILGEGMSSRLFTSIRDKQGLAYYIKNYSEHYTDAGFLMTHAGVDTKRIDLAIKTILKEYKSLKTKLVPKEELQKAKDILKGRLLLRLETTDAWAEYFAAQELFESKILTPEEECKKIDKVTQRDILKVAKEIFRSERLNLALIGPFKDKEKFQKLLKI